MRYKGETQDITKEETPLEKCVKRSGIDTLYDGDFISYAQKYGAKVSTLGDFSRGINEQETQNISQNIFEKLKDVILSLISKRYRTFKNFNGFSLGLSGKNIVAAISEETKLMQWMEYYAFYDKHFSSTDEHMKYLVSDSKLTGKKIRIFIPTEIFGIDREEADKKSAKFFEENPNLQQYQRLDATPYGFGVTTEEIMWLKDHPESLKYVEFVFDVYRFFNENQESKSLYDLKDFYQTNLILPLFGKTSLVDRERSDTEEIPKRKKELIAAIEAEYKKFGSYQYDRQFYINFELKEMKKTDTEFLGRYLKFLRKLRKIDENYDFSAFYIDYVTYRKYTDNDDLIMDRILERISFSEFLDKTKKLKLSPDGDETKSVKVELPNGRKYSIEILPENYKGDWNFAVTDLKKGKTSQIGLEKLKSLLSIALILDGGTIFILPYGDKETKVYLGEQQQEQASEIEQETEKQSTYPKQAQQQEKLFDSIKESNVDKLYDGDGNFYDYVTKNGAKVSTFEDYSKEIINEPYDDGNLSEAESESKEKRIGQYRGFSLGLTGRNIVAAISEVDHLMPWGEYYKLYDMFTSVDDHLSHLVADSEQTGKKIIVFVATHVDAMSEEESAERSAKFFEANPDLQKFAMKTTGVSRKEIEWLLSHPESLKHVEFVFDAYKFFDENRESKSLYDLKKFYRESFPDKSSPSDLSTEYEEITDQEIEQLKKEELINHIMEVCTKFGHYNKYKYTVSPALLAEENESFLRKFLRTLRDSDTGQENIEKLYSDYITYKLYTDDYDLIMNLSTGKLSFDKFLEEVKLLSFNYEKDKKQSFIVETPEGKKYSIEINPQLYTNDFNLYDTKFKVTDLSNGETSEMSLGEIQTQFSISLRNNLYKEGEKANIKDVKILVLRDNMQEGTKVYLDEQQQETTSQLEKKPEIQQPETQPTSPQVEQEQGQESEQVQQEKKQTDQYEFSDEEKEIVHRLIDMLARDNVLYKVVEIVDKERITLPKQIEDEIMDEIGEAIKKEHGSTLEIIPSWQDEGELLVWLNNKRNKGLDSYINRVIIDFMIKQEKLRKELDSLKINPKELVNIFNEILNNEALKKELFNSMREIVKKEEIEIKEREKKSAKREKEEERVRANTERENMEESERDILNRKIKEREDIKFVENREDTIVDRFLEIINFLENNGYKSYEIEQIFKNWGLIDESIRKDTSKHKQEIQATRQELVVEHYRIAKAIIDMLKIDLLINHDTFVRDIYDSYVKRKRDSTLWNPNRAFGWFKELKMNLERLSPREEQTLLKIFNKADTDLIIGPEESYIFLKDALTDDTLFSGLGESEKERVKEIINFLTSDESYDTEKIEFKPLMEMAIRTGIYGYPSQLKELIRLTIEQMGKMSVGDNMKGKNIIVEDGTVIDDVLREKAAEQGINIVTLKILTEPEAIRKGGTVIGGNQIIRLQFNQLESELIVYSKYGISLSVEEIKDLIETAYSEGRKDLDFTDQQVIAFAEKGEVVSSDIEKSLVNIQNRITNAAVNGVQRAEVEVSLDLSDIENIGSTLEQKCENIRGQSTTTIILKASQLDKYGSEINKLRAIGFRFILRGTSNEIEDAFERKGIFDGADFRLDGAILEEVGKIGDLDKLEDLAANNTEMKGTSLIETQMYVNMTTVSERAKESIDINEIYYNKGIMPIVTIEQATSMTGKHAIQYNDDEMKDKSEDEINRILLNEGLANILCSESKGNQLEKLRARLAKIFNNVFGTINELLKPKKPEQKIAEETTAVSDYNFGEKFGEEIEKVRENLLEDLMKDGKIKSILTTEFTEESEAKMAADNFVEDDSSIYKQLPAILQMRLQTQIDEGKYFEAIGTIRGFVNQVIDQAILSKYEGSKREDYLKKEYKEYRQYMRIRAIQLVMAGENLSDLLELRPDTNQTVEELFYSIRTEVNKDVRKTIIANKVAIKEISDKEKETAKTNFMNINVLMEENLRPARGVKQLEISAQAVRSILAAA